MTNVINGFKLTVVVCLAYFANTRMMLRTRSGLMDQESAEKERQNRFWIFAALNKHAQVLRDLMSSRSESAMLHVH